MRRYLLVLLLGLGLIATASAGVFDPGGGGNPFNLTVKENDDAPTVTGVNSISFTNGTVTDGGGGAVSVTISGTGAPTDATYITQTANGTLSAEQALGTLGTGCMSSTTTTGVVATRTITGTANQITIANGDCSGNPTISITTNPTLPGTTTGTFSGNLTGNASGTAGSLAANGANCSAGSAPLGVDTLGAVESCTDYAEEPAGTGILAKTAANTVAARTITGTANEISVAEGAGATGNPTISLPATINLSAKTLRIPNGTERPASCTTGDQFMDTDATTGQRHYLCESANTWVLQGDGGGGGGGTVTSVDATGGVQTASGSAITTTGTIRGVHIAKAETGTTYTFLTGDRGKAITFSNAGSIAVTLPQAGTGFEDGWYVWAKNIGAGTVTITPTTSTIDGTTALTLATGQMAMIRSDGTNYQSYGKAVIAEVDTINATFLRDREIKAANSEANCLKIGDDTNYACLWWDATDGFRMTTNPIGDLTHWIPTNKNYILHDEENDTAVVTIDPDAGGLGIPSVTYRAGTVFTGVTLDAEGSNNTITTREERHFPVATCQNAAASANFDLPTTNAPTATCDTGSNTQKGYLAFNDSTDQSFQDSWILPTGFTGAIDVHFRWKAAATSGAVGWCAQLIRVADGATSDPAFPAQAAGNCVSDTAKGTTLQENAASITGVTCSSCVAGDHVYVRISRDADGGAVTDSMTGNALLLTYGRTLRVAQ